MLNLKCLSTHYCDIPPLATKLPRSASGIRQIVSKLLTYLPECRQLGNNMGSMSSIVVVNRQQQKTTWNTLFLLLDDIYRMTYFKIIVNMTMVFILNLVILKHRIKPKTKPKQKTQPTV